MNQVVDNDSYNNDDFCDNLANHFWRRLGPTTPPSMYGADMEGSLFGGDDASGWSLAKLDNCLQLLSADQGSTELPGVTTPYLYVGMWGSVFCVYVGQYAEEVLPGLVGSYAVVSLTQHCATLAVTLRI